MIKHVSVRFAWHDDKWDGGICRDPERNVYCTGNYSLLSPRIQRRINLDIEDKYKNQRISVSKKERNYVPPCYWCINALGNEEYLIEDQHPFGDAGGRASGRFKVVPPLKYKLKESSVFTWNFRIGYAEEGSPQRYVPDDELKRRTGEYLDAIEKGKSIAFFYANYSNPLTGDDYEYLLLGAGLVKDVKEPEEYDIPDELVEFMRSKPRMQNFPKLAWQFQIMLEPKTVFVLPYHEYLNELDKEDETESMAIWEKLDDVVVRIEDETILPHFKYVSKHLPHDKSIYLLYLLRESVRKMKEHKLVDHAVTKEMERKTDELLSIAWQQRGRYPGFSNVLFAALSGDFDKDYLKELIQRIEKHIVQNFGSVQNYLEDAKGTREQTSTPSDVLKGLRIVERRKDLVKFLSLFDFSINQFENFQEIIDEFGLESVRRNPYIILEKYHYDWEDSWNIDESDYGIGLYQIDIALIPDPKYVDWETLYDSRSPQRLRALVNQILSDSATYEGNSCLTREDIIERIQEYPLYYILEKLRVDANVLSDYEKQSIFKERFLIKEDIAENQIIYQLNTIRGIENTVEQFVDKLLRKTHTVDSKAIEEIIKLECELFKDKLDVNERKCLYSNSLKSGLFALTGKAGSGKTHAVVNLIKKFMEAKKLPVFVFTPTGKANLVIRGRLKKLGLHKDSRIRVSTIHRFLYRALSDYYQGYTVRRDEIFKLTGLISRILLGKLELFDEFKKLAKGWKFNPKVLILDEASMVDEVLLAVLFCLINPDALDHLILVGDERQLPPIGIGRPFADMIFSLRQKGSDANIVHLESNLRFDSSKKLGMLSELFRGREPPSLNEIDEVVGGHDDSLEVQYFSDPEELRRAIQRILGEIGCSNDDKSLFEMFVDTFETGGTLNLDKVQILTPRRVGDFGSVGINRRIVMGGIMEYLPKTKLICEENIYFNVKGSRVLGLANGSIGYIKNEGYVYFEDISELIADYGFESVRRLINQVRSDVYSPFRTESRIDLGYAVTIHKAQGSDFEHVILVFSQINPFITRELLYTGFTRPRVKLHLLVHNDLKDELALVLARAYENSLVEQRRTLLFGHKGSPFKPYKLVLENKTVIQVDSKIECLIAQVLDKLGVRFEHGPTEFYAEHRIVPDFKLFFGEKVFYFEHLGRMDNIGYRERWYRKLETYKKLGLLDILVTTSESEESSNIEENVKKIIDDILSNKLRQTEGYSYHHYEI